MKKKIVVLFSGGMDSSLCLALAIREFGAEHVLGMTFQYGQRHQLEIEQAKKICLHFEVDHIIIPLDCLNQITDNALINSKIPIQQIDNSPPNTLVVGRNGLMVRLAAIHAQSVGANIVSTGIIEVEEASSGYRDCSRKYMDLMEKILKIDLNDSHFEIRTPIVQFTKKKTLELADKLEILPFLLENTVTCYEGIPYWGCEQCPSCKLRNEGIKNFLHDHPKFSLPYSYLTH